MPPSRKGKKPDGFEIHDSITIAVGGEIIGRIKNWEPTPLREETVQNYKNYVSQLDSLTRVEPFPVGSFGSEMWTNILRQPREPGKVQFPEAQVRVAPDPDEPSFVTAQLNMWGFEDECVLPIHCVELLVHELEEMGYHVWFDSEARPDTELMEAQGVTQNFKFDYVTTTYGEEGDSE